MERAASVRKRKFRTAIPNLLKLVFVFDLVSCRLRQDGFMPSIVVLKTGSSATHELTEDETVIGRLPECQIQIDSNMVSRRHAKIVHDADGYALMDLGSGNGTTLNGEEVKGEKRLRLKHDDRIKLGPRTKPCCTVTAMAVRLASLKRCCCKNW